MNKQKIIAIGGGEIGRPNKKGGFLPIETTKIDKEIVALTGKKHPKILFIIIQITELELKLWVMQDLHLMN